MKANEKIQKTCNDALQFINVQMQINPPLELNATSSYKDWPRSSVYSS